MGGTFDPPHVGHLLAAADAFDCLALDRLVFVPAARQPLKQDQESAPAPHRLRMVELMVTGDVRFSVDAFEVERSGLSFTVDTLEEYARRFPDAERFFVLGVDAFALLDQWRLAARVVSLARLAILAREAEISIAGVDVETRVRTIGGSTAQEPVIVNARRVDVSSTEIRARVRGGRSIRGFVADAVAEYIALHGLYQ